MYFPIGPSVGSPVKNTLFPSVISDAASIFACEVVPLPSGPSKTMKVPFIRSKGYKISAIMIGKTHTVNPHTSIPAVLLREFVPWYYRERPRQIVKTYHAYARAFLQIFSIFFLLRTLFSPWKAITDVYPARGFNLEAILSVFALNATARLIGAVIRLTTIIFGIFLQMLMLVGVVLWLLVWLLFPFFLVASPILLPRFL